MSNNLIRNYQLQFLHPNNPQYVESLAGNSDHKVSSWMKNTQYLAETAAQ